MNRMTNRSLVLAMWSALACSASAVGQTSEGDQASQPAGQSKQQSPMPATNSDRMFSAQEHAAAAEAMFQRMDADGDGHLTASEMEHGRGMMAGAGTHGATGAGKMGPGMGPGMMGGTGLGMMDSDGDGAVSAQEHAAMAQMMFQRMDANSDGRITADEMGKGRGMMMDEGMSGPGRGMGTMGAMGAGMGLGMSPAERIKMMDRDGDGRISASEHRAGTQSLFDEADTDNDGVLSMAERAAHQAKMRQRAMDAD